MLKPVTCQMSANYLLQSAEISLWLNLYTLEVKKPSHFLHLNQCDCLVCILLQYLLVYLKCQNLIQIQWKKKDLVYASGFIGTFFLPSLQNELTSHVICCIVFPPPFNIKDT